MGLSIKNDEVERLARELADLRKVSITEAIRQSLEREVDRERIDAGSARSERLKRIYAIVERSAALPILSDASEDDILGYDECGAPTR